MFYPALTDSTDDLVQILQLQQQNHFKNITAAEKDSQGFVTLRHDIVVLEKMHAIAPSVIIKENNKVIAYALTMLRECCDLVTDLKPMFALLDTLAWQEKPVKDLSFYVMGQICIAKEFRGKGLFEILYTHHKFVFSSQFDLLVTEISTSNQRSIRAHERIGFETIHSHKEENDEWNIVCWDWK